MAGLKGRFKIRGEDGKVRTYGNCQSAGQAVKKFILLALPPVGYHGTVWRMGDERNSKNFRVTQNRIRQAKEDKRLRKRYLNDLEDIKVSRSKPKKKPAAARRSSRDISPEQIAEVASRAARAAVAQLLGDDDN